MKLNKIITMAALSAAFLVTPACNSGGGGGGGGGKNNDNNDNPASDNTVTQGNAPASLVGMKMTWINTSAGNQLHTYVFKENKIVSCHASLPNQSSHNDTAGDYVYNKLSENRATLYINWNSGLRVGGTKYYENWQLTFTTPHEANTILLRKTSEIKKVDSNGATTTSMPVVTNHTDIVSFSK